VTNTFEILRRIHAGRGVPGVDDADFDAKGEGPQLFEGFLLLQEPRRSPG
jgi:hypothetical protein